ncbi:hypothetical protein F5X99DRAFT_110073 [Biscogniauxia marginata]|nr:hypothetical protein F5X99DRAFT_110073 [Biscogniauxia marginata]
MTKAKLALLPTYKSVLAMSRAQFLRHIRGSEQPADKVYIGVCIFRVDVESSCPSVLLLRRSPRWQQHPGNWELPGGKVGDGDFCISAAVARLVSEESGLKVTKILGALRETRHVNRIKILEWDDDKDVAVAQVSDEGSSEFNRRELRKECLQLNFTVLVDDVEDAVLMSKNHDGMVWVNLSRVEGLQMSSDLRGMIYEGLAWAGEYLF